MSTIKHTELDSVIIRMLEIVLELQQKRTQLESLMKDGFLCLSKSRYVIGNKAISRTQYNIAENSGLKIQTNIKSKTNLFEIESDIIQSTTKDTITEDPALRNRNQKKDGIVLDVNKERTVDPINWFGVLVPQTLRHSQKHFRQCVLLCVDIASLENELLIMYKVHTLSKQNADDLLTSLNLLYCPFTKDIDSAYITTVLFEPNEHRLQILKWLLSKIHPDVTGILKSSKQPLTSKTKLQIDPQLKILTSLASTIGLCSPCDFDVVRGYASTQHQINFWNQLIAVAKEINVTCDGESKVLNKLVNGDGYSDTSFMTQLTASSSFFSPDIKKAIQITQQLTKKKNIKATPISELQEDLSQLILLLEQETSSLAQLEKNSKYIKKEDPGLYETIVKSYKLNLIDLEQMFEAFRQVFFDTYAPICSHQTQEFTSLGDTIRDVNKMLKLLLNFLQNLSTISNNQEKILHTSKLLSENKENKNVSTCLNGLNKTIQGGSFSTGDFTSTVDQSSDLLHEKTHISSINMSLGIGNSQYKNSKMFNTLENVTKII